MRDASTRTLVVIVGPSAVGKMTVGQALAARTGMTLYHNHLSIESVLPVFWFGEPAFGRLVDRIRALVFDEVIASDPARHLGLIFTFVWAFDSEEDHAYMASVRERFEAAGWRVCYAELRASLTTRLERNRAPERLAAKPSKRDVAATERHMRDGESAYRTHTLPDERLPAAHHRFDAEHASPEALAAQIAAAFALPLVEG